VPEPGDSSAPIIGHETGPSEDGRAEGANGNDGSASAESGDAGTTVVGAVVDFTTTRPFSGRSVVIAGQRTTTDDHGKFTVSNVGATYDAIVADPDGSAISMYRGLTRRDPLLPHFGTSAMLHTAAVSGILSGGGNYPLTGSDAVEVHFFSDEADGQTLLGGQLPVGMGGPNFGPLPLSWSGGDSLNGRVVAIGTFYGSDAGSLSEGGPSSYLFTQPLTVSSGQTAVVALALSPVTQSGHVAGKIEVPAGSRILEKQLFYRFPTIHSTLTVPGQSAPPSAIDSVVPDLTT
jgi:hypothetical protein